MTTTAVAMSTAPRGRRRLGRVGLRRLRLAGRLAVLAIAGLVFVVNVGNLFVVVGTSLTDTLYPIFPPRGLSLRWYRELGEYWPSVVYSLQVSFVASTISTVLATAAAVVLVRGRVRAKQAVLSALLSPLIIPSSVFALAVLVVLIRVGWRPGFWPLALALTVHGCPFAVRIILSGLQNLDWTLEAAARTLGASRRRAWLQVMLPVAGPAIAAAWMLGFILAFDDSTISVFLSSLDNETYGAKLLSKLENLSPSVAAAGAAITLITLVLVLILGLIYRIQRKLTGQVSTPLGDAGNPRPAVVEAPAAV